MKKYAYSDPSPARNIGTIIWSVLTVVTLLLTVCVVGVFLIIYTNPTSSLQ